eukprot:4670805-Pleurochrysis_carterae.AAC.7
MLRCMGTWHAHNWAWLKATAVRVAATRIYVAFSIQELACSGVALSSAATSPDSLPLRLATMVASCFNAPMQQSENLR